MKKIGETKDTEKRLLLLVNGTSLISCSVMMNSHGKSELSGHWTCDSSEWTIVSTKHSLFVKKRIN